MPDHIAVPDALRALFAEHPRVALAFSGGVDSAYLLYAGHALGADMRAYYVKSAFQPAFETRDAERLARELGMPMTVIELPILENDVVAANPADRCYHCKRAIFSAILDSAKADGYTTLFDGTNASDDAGDRPGMRAIAELNVLSPLRLAGMTKADVRAASRAAGLFTWDKPAYACLATRIPSGTRITAEALAAVERCEAALMALGFSGLRVRARGRLAKLEAPDAQMERLLARRLDVVQALATDFDEVTLDLTPRQEA